MKEHDCGEICLYCMVETTYETIFKLRESNHRLAIEVLTLRREKEEMDKQINKVKKDIEKGNKTKGEKDVKKLLKMDKKFDAKLDKCDIKMKKKK